jgi:polysaccharide biosynthesis transport protein
MSAPDLEVDAFGDERILTLRDYLVVLRRHRLLIVTTVVLALTASLTWSLTRSPLYEASSLISVTDVSSLDPSSGPAVSGSVQSQIDVLSSRPTRERVEAIVGSTGNVSISRASRESDAIRVRVTSTDAARAARIANAYADVFSDIRRESDLERNARSITVVRQRYDEIATELRRLGIDPITGEARDARSTELLSLLRTYDRQLRLLDDQAAFIAQGRVAIIDPAVEADRPFSPQPVRDAALALLVGLLGGLGIALLRDHLRDTVQDDLDVRRATGMRPLIGRIPVWQLPSGLTKGAVTLTDPSSIASEAYRELSTNVRFLVLGRRGDRNSTDARGGSVMLVSAGAYDGKTSTAVNLAVTAARSGQRVVLVDADLRRASVGAYFGMGRLKGLSDVLVDRSAATAALIAVGVDNLRILPAGTTPPNPTELLAGRGMDRVHEELCSIADLVIYDTPAALAVPDVLEVGRLVDGAVLVLRHRRSTRRAVASTIERLENLGIPVIGTVLNDIDTKSDAYYYYYSYYYQSGYADDAAGIVPTDQRPSGSTR